jgi:hypothetical protein
MNRSPRARLISIPSIAALIIALVGCGSDKSGSAPGTQSAPPPPPPPPPPAAFTATLGAASVTVSQGSRVGVWVNITRDSSFTGAVTVSLDTPPAGLRPFTLTIASLSTAGLYQVRSAPDLAVGGPIALTLVASGGDTTVRLPVTATVTAARPSTESLIAADLSAGTIDYATSLLYRAYARFHDPRLPAQYAGSVNARDDGFFVEASNPALSAAVQAAMQPYLARPTDAASWFQQSGAAQRAGRARAIAHTASGSTASPCTLTDGEVEYQGWKSLLLPLVGGGSLRFWVACNAEVTGFDDATLAYMSGNAGPIADAEVAMMGPPVGDLGGLYFGTDNAIDVYLIDDCLQDVPPRANSTTLCDKEENTGSVVGAAIVTNSNATGNACSDFMIIDRAEIDGGSYKSTFAHEFFHVLQDAYACQLGESDGTGEYWFREASATWAEANFVPETAVAEVHNRFVNDFQKSTESLHQSNGADADHMYSAYIWPFFFDQKKGGGAGSVQAAWKSLRGAGSFDAANQALDGVYKFKTNFRDFAVTNLNVPRPDALPDSAVYTAEPAFPSGEPDIAAVEFSAAAKINEALNLDALRADYTRYSVTSQTVKKLKFTFSGIQVRDGLDIDALVEIDGQPWERRNYDDADTVKFCLDKPDQNLKDSIWVLSNHNVPFDQVVTGLVKVEASEVACGKSWSGQANSDFGDTMHAVVTWVFDDQHSTDTVAVFYPTGTVSFNAPGCTVNPGSSSIGQGEGSLRIDYSTTPATYQLSGATVWLATWKCGTGNPFQASTGGFWLADFNKTPPYATGTVPAVDKNGNIVLSGTNNSTGFTFGWTFTDD